MIYRRSLQVRFKDCDPAGIVFYPRYFEMINDTVEDFFGDVLGYPFHTMHPKTGVPTVKIETEFLSPSRHGDDLTITLTVVKLGRTSLSYEQVARSGGDIRFKAHATLVHVDAVGRPSPWPDAIRNKIDLP